MFACLLIKTTQKVEFKTKDCLHSWIVEPNSGMSRAFKLDLIQTDVDQTKLMNLSTCDYSLYENWYCGGLPVFMCSQMPLLASIFELTRLFLLESNTNHVALVVFIHFPPLLKSFMSIDHVSANVTMGGGIKKKKLDILIQLFRKVDLK